MILRDDIHGITHWFRASIPRHDRGAKPVCNYGHGKGVFAMTKTRGASQEWPTCLRCSVYKVSEEP